VCLQSALYAESRGEPPEGIRAVATVIYNRTKHKNYPSDFCGVIKQPYQFSYLNGGKPIVKPTYKPSEHQVKATIDQLAFEAAIGSLKPSLGPEYLFYHTTKLKKIPKWSKTKVASAIIGNHIFIGA
jgi:spore germination cell wall hydrolase CwlJ-like protein